MTNLPIKYKENIFKKIWNFFKNKYKKDTEQTSSYINIQTTKEENNFRLDLQKEYNTIKTKDTIIEEIMEDPDLVYTLSDDKLKKVIGIFDEKIAQLDIEINRLEKELLTDE